MEKPCSAARQEGITAQELVVTGACDGVHKLSEHRSCSDWVLFHFDWAHGLSAETPGVTELSWLRIGDRSPQNRV